MPVLVDLWAPWCAPCRVVAPAVTRAARELAGHLKVVKVNVDEAPEVADALSVDSVPTLVLIHGGRILGRHLGAASESRLLEWIRTTLARPAA
jgi:thioredoxin 2